ncbi:MAG: hypothetical protein OIF58_15115, partial [Cohaesibacter sp.]|nr:hypothetical protein [Cohaesibacter sp.]
WRERLAKPASLVARPEAEASLLETAKHITAVRRFYVLRALFFLCLQKRTLVSLTALISTLPI